MILSFYVKIQLQTDASTLKLETRLPNITFYIVVVADVAYNLGNIIQKHCNEAIS